MEASLISWSEYWTFAKKCVPLIEHNISYEYDSAD